MTSFQFPNTIEGFGYHFNEFGQLRNIQSGEEFVFEVKKNDQLYNQRRYEALGELINDYVYELLIKEGNLKKMKIPIDAASSDASTFIFHSEDAFTNEKIIVLIHGSGVVRAGQWSRRLIINDDINSGTQLPYIKRAFGLGYGVVVLNTNDNSRDGIKIQNSSSPEVHANYVWENVIRKTAAKYIGIIAHSYGGVVTVNLCKKFEKDFCKRVFAVAFTDSVHNLLCQELSPESFKWFCKNARNWISSKEPLDTFLPGPSNNEIPCYSAGTQRHDSTSWKSFASVYEFVDAQYREALGRDDCERRNT